MIDEEKVFEIDHYNGIQIQKYKDTYSLLAMQKGGGEQSEVWYKIWTFLSFWKNGDAIPGDKKRPMAIRLGNKEKALETLKELYKEIQKG